MIKIDKSSWLIDTYAQVLKQDDLIRQPLENYHALTNKEKDQLRQTQVFVGEIVQVLGTHEGLSLVRKFEQTLGWIPSRHLKPSEQTNLIIPRIAPTTAQEFFEHWKGTVYEFGGLSKDGIDCSGFTQLYYLGIHNTVLPKNSRDQRKLGQTTTLEHIQDHDLIFCRPYAEMTSHHVAISFGQQVWHSRRKGGVVCQVMDEFLKEFQVEDVRRFI